MSRQTALRNGIDRYLAHETWEDRSGLWSGKGQVRLRKVLAARPHCRSVGMKEIEEENDFNMNVSRYVSTAEAEEEIDLAATLGELAKIAEEIRKARDSHNKYLKELGLPPLPHLHFLTGAATQSPGMMRPGPRSESMFPRVDESQEEKVTALPHGTEDRIVCR